MALRPTKACTKGSTGGLFCLVQPMSCGWHNIACANFGYTDDQLFNASQPSSGKKNKFGHFLVVVQLIHGLTQAHNNCTTTACLFFFPLLDHNNVLFLWLHPFSRSMKRQPNTRLYLERDFLHRLADISKALALEHLLPPSQMVFVWRPPRRLRCVSRVLNYVDAWRVEMQCRKNCPSLLFSESH